MARNMITGKETQKMQEFTQEQMDRAEHMGIAIPADIKEQIFEYANLIGEEEKVRTLVKNLTERMFCGLCHLSEYRRSLYGKKQDNG